MASDVYLQIEGIKGESADGRHKDWIECQSATLVNFAATVGDGIDWRRTHR